MKPKALLQITRPLNAFVAGLAGILAYVIATGTLIPAVLIIFLMVLLITAAGNVINDYHDAAIDAINRPDRPIPSGMITRREAYLYSLVLFVVGNAIGILLAPVPLILIAIGNSLLLWFYASHLKVMPLLGNIAVSYLTASIFLFGGALEGWTGVMANLPVAGATFCVMISRELIKDAEDMPGDEAHGARTFPILYGLKISILIAGAAAIIGVGISLLLFFRWGVYYLAGIIPVDLIILIGSLTPVRCKTPEEIKKNRSATLVKTGMFLSLLIFLISAVLFR